MKSKQKQKRAQILIFALIGLIVISLIVALILAFSTKDEKTEPVQNMQTEKRPETVKADDYDKNDEKFREFEKEYREDAILPRNISTLYAYKGEYDRKDLYESLKKFVKLLEKLKLDVNSDNTNKYFEKNLSDIYSVTGVGDEEEFNALISKISNMDVSSKEFKYAEIVANSLKSEDLYTSFDVNLYYGEDLEKIELEVSLANKKITEPEFKYTLK